MAAVSRRFVSSNPINSFKIWTSFVRSKSDAHVAMTDDSSTIVCWHPEKKFPYEKSLPIPEKIEMKSDSVLKIQSNKEFLSILKPKRQEVVIQELTKLTYSTKHIWFPRGRSEIRKKKGPGPDRPYL